MLALGALLGALGCNDDVIQDLSSPTDTTKEKEVVQAFLAKNAPPAQHFTVDSDQPIEIVTKGRLTFKFEKNAFKNSTGQIASGNVDISITEYLSNADIIYGGVTTTTANQLLQSGGMFNIEVTQNGQQLSLNSKQYDVDFPTDAIDYSMLLFKGKEVINENGEPDISWEENYDSWVSDDSIRQDTIYRTKLGFLNWGNLDKYALTTNGSIVHLKLPEIYTNKNTLVYTVLADRSITYMYSSQAKKEFNSKQYLMPADLDFKILVISSADGNLKYKLIHSKVVPNHMEVVAELDAVSEADLDQVIQNI